jgi:hypothetical protein
LFACSTAARGADPAFDIEQELEEYLVSEVVCVEQEGPPNGALAIAASPLAWAHAQRVRIHDGGVPEVPEPELLLDWLDVAPVPRNQAVALGLEVARAPFPANGADWVVQVEARAYQRRPVLAPNFTIVVDISPSMITVHERGLPPLQDEPGPLYRPVTRLDIVKAALEDLFARAPDSSRVSIVAMDALQARGILPPTELRDAAVVQEAVDRLEPGLVRPDDPLTPQVLEKFSDLTFDKCHDNKVVLLTDHVDQLVQRKAVQDVARWAADDVEVWSFGVGLNDDVEAELALLGAAAGGASWLINARSDYERIWRHILDPGGVVASDVYVQVDFPPGARWRTLPGGPGRDSPLSEGAASFSLGTVRSGETWARVFEVHLPPGAQDGLVAPLADLGASVLHERGEVRLRPDPSEPVPPFAWAAPTLRARALAAYWIDRPANRAVYRMGDVLEPEGTAAELKAWFEHIRVRSLGGASRMPEREAFVPPEKRAEHPLKDLDDPRVDPDDPTETLCVEGADDIPWLNADACE